MIALSITPLDGGAYSYTQVPGASGFQAGGATCGGIFDDLEQLQNQLAKWGVAESKIPKQGFEEQIFVEFEII